MGFLFVALGGMLGALSRYSVYLAVRSLVGSGVPLATLAVNVVGCFAIGAAGARAAAPRGLDPDLRLFLVIGFLGSFTTYSAFGFETFEYLRAGRTGVAAGLAVAHLTLGLAAVWLGFRAFA